GLIVAGESVLIPAIFLAASKELHLPYIVGLAMLATIGSDYIWYYIGSHMSKLEKNPLVGKRVLTMTQKLSHAFSKRASLVLFLSKFVYGTRIATQVLAGERKMPLRTYFPINFLGTFTLIMCIALLIFSIDMTVANIQSIVHDVEIILLAAIGLIVLGHLAFGAYIKKTWFQ
nr:VTT domain-containing protein [bacterium]